MNVDSLTAKQRAVAKPLVEAITRLDGFLDRRDRHYYERRVLTYGAQLSQMRNRLAEQLDAEDTRLRTEGTTDELDDRWILNLRRYEAMSAVLRQAESVLPGMQVAA